MESGFLNGNKPSKAAGLAARISNIEGKVLNNASMPLKSFLRNAGLGGKTGSYALPCDHGSVVSDLNGASNQGGSWIALLCMFLFVMIVVLLLVYMGLRLMANP